jgi:hypothetical protein
MTGCSAAECFGSVGRLTGSLYGYTGGNPLQFVDPLGLDWLQTLADGAAGFGDTITFGGTKAIRDLINYEMGYDDAVTYNSGAYTAGAVTPTVTAFVLPGGSAAYGAVNTVGAGLQGVRAAQGGDTSGPILNGIAAASGTGGVVSSLGRLSAWASSASSGGAFVRSGTWWSRLGQRSEYVEWFGGGFLTGANSAYLLDQMC